MIQQDDQEVLKGTDSSLQDDGNGKPKSIDIRRETFGPKNPGEILYRNLVERMPDGVYKSTHDGRFVEVNPALVRMLGYNSKEELMAVDIATQLYFEHEDRENITLLEQTHQLDTFRMRKKDGAEIWVEDHGWYTYDDSGKVLFHEGILRDITDRKRAEQQLQTQAEELKELNGMKDKLFSIIAHDLRGPFNAILGLSDILKENYRELDDQAIESSLSAISEASRQAYTLLENLLIWSQSQTGRLAFEPIILSAGAEIRECVRIIYVLAEKKNIDIRIMVPDYLTLFADRNMFGTIMRNLIGNAVKFTPRNGRILVSARQGNGTTIVEVEDSGIGISPEKLQKIFRPDRDQIGQGTDREKGSGIGLILCKEFVERHQGKILVKSEPGKGSVFTVVLPEMAHPG